MTVTIEEPALLRRPEELVHQLRGSVAGIVAATRLLHGEGRGATGQTERLELLLESELRRLEHLVGEHRGGDDTEPLDATIDDVVLSHRVRGLDVRWRPEPCGRVRHAWELREALHVLLDNAARHAPGATVSITLRPHDGWVEVRVADDGPGVPDTLRGRLCQRGARRADSPGQGLGLNLARRLLVDLGGTLRLDPSGTGAAFVAVVPLATGAVER